MYNLEEEIARWRQRMAAGGVKAPAVLDELESHLREEIRVQMADGAREEEAFKLAVVRIGSAASVRAEFDKIKGTTSLPVMIMTSAWALLVVLMLSLVLRQMARGRADALAGAHAFTLVAGFLAAFVVGSLGVCYLCWQLFGTLSSERSASLHKAVSVFTRISLGFMVVGYFLGLLWASKPREFHLSGSFQESTVFMIFWLVALELVQRFKQIGEHALMLLCAGSNVVVAMGWFGVGFLTMDPQLTQVLLYWPLGIFVMVHLLLMAMSLERGLKPAES